MNKTHVDFDQDVLQSPVPVLVDFTASWCGPCKSIAPAIERVASEFSDRAKVVAIDIDEQPEIAMKFGIMSVPTLIVFKDGQPVERTIGAIPHQAIRELVERNL